MLFQVDALTILEITGRDASLVLNNLATANVGQLQTSQGVETFVTEVRGRTVGHICAYRKETGILLVGPTGQAERLLQHIDRYIIREDATLNDHSDRYQAVLLAQPLAGRFADDYQITPLDSPLLAAGQAEIGGKMVTVCQVPWLGQPAYLCLQTLPRSSEESLQPWWESRIATADNLPSMAEFHHQRVLAGFPWFGIDLNESHLPQEADRNAETISFTKGCYLGQETVARLDALGQVQKKLCRWQIATTAAIPTGTPLLSGEKKVGTVTSTAVVDDTAIAIAIAMTRRSHFEPGSTATCLDWPAVVL